MEGIYCVEIDGGGGAFTIGKGFFYFCLRFFCTKETQNEFW